MWVNKFKPTKQITQIKNGHYSPELWKILCKLKTNKWKIPTNNPGVEEGEIPHTEILFTTDRLYHLFFIVNHQYSFAFHSVHICCISLLALSQACSLLFWTQEKSLRITMEQCPYRQLSRTLPSWQMYLKRKVKNKTSLQITYDTSEFLFNFNDQGTFYS